MEVTNIWTASDQKVYSTLDTATSYASTSAFQHYISSIYLHQTLPPYKERPWNLQLKISTDRFFKASIKALCMCCPNL